MKVYAEEFEKFLGYKKLINDTNLSDIELHQNNEKVIIKPEDLEKWKFTGLSNFGILEIWLDGGTEFVEEEL